MEAPQEGEPDFAAMVFFDEITRGDAFMCKHPGVKMGEMRCCLVSSHRHTAL